MQDTRIWKPPTGVLGKILALTDHRVARLRPAEAALRARALSTSAPPNFARAITGGNNVAVIAEVKRKSPSKGVIGAEIDAVARARAYEEGGAAAVSVLTEEDHFGGSIADLTAVTSALRIPALRKDFCIDQLQLLEARASGAAAMLLIARALPPEKLLELAQFAEEIGLQTLVEVRSEQELELALQSKGNVIGVNNRDLETLEISVRISQKLIPQVPASVPVVFESGVASAQDVLFAASTGADAVLVGSALSASEDARNLVRSFTGVARQKRGSRN